MIDLAEPLVVKALVDLYQGELPMKEIGPQLGLEASRAAKLVRRHAPDLYRAKQIAELRALVGPPKVTWTAPMHPPPEPPDGQRFRLPDKHPIRALHQHGWSIEKLSETFNLPVNRITRIVGQHTTASALLDRQTVRARSPRYTPQRRRRRASKGTTA